MIGEKLYVLIAVIAWCVGVVSFCLPARGDHVGHPPEHVQLHEQFYTNWNRPEFRNDIGERKHSCCSNEDCAPVNRVEYRADGTVWALRTKDQQWIKIPEKIIESNQDDPRESPDGFSHMCSSGTKVYCFVLGSAT